MRARRYQELFKPLAIGNLTLKNRIVKAPYSSTNADAEGYVLDSAVHHYAAVARGGVGLFITESVAVQRNGVTGSPRMAIWDDSYIPGQQRLAEVVHEHGVPIIMQLQHAGPSYSTGAYGSWSQASVEELQPRAPSSLTQEQLPGARPNLPVGLSVEEIAEVVEAFTDGAQRAATAGYDGVEIHAATTYLLASFLSRAWNKRTDQYGGSVENRCRIVVEIIERVRERLGADFIIAVRYNGFELGARHGDGLTYEEAARIGQILEDAGADLLDVTAVGYEHFEWVLFPEQMLFPEAPAGTEAFAAAVKRGSPLVDGAANIKRAVRSVPVVTVGKLSFDRAEQALKEGSVDLVAFARALISDPDAPNKLREGRLDEVRGCTHCITCVDAFARGEHERCRVNAAFGREGEMRIVPAEQPKRILVVGGGPAGMEAARVAALRGHHVALYERGPKLGGLMPLMSFVKGTEVEDVPPFVDYLAGQMDHLGVEVHTSTDVDVELVRRANPDVVLLATGAKLDLPQIAGIESRNVVTTHSLHKRVKLPLRLLGPEHLERASKLWLPMIGKRVLVVGGQFEGIELAEFLVKRGRQVTVTDPADTLGDGLLAVHRTRVLEWLQEQGTALLTGVTYNEITAKGVDLTTDAGERRFIAVDTTVVLALRNPDHALQELLRPHVAEVHTVGDCDTPGLIVDAVEAGHKIALTV